VGEIAPRDPRKVIGITGDFAHPTGWDLGKEGHSNIGQCGAARAIGITTPERLKMTAHPETAPRVTPWP
jgi:hypothetical protein